MNKDWIRLNRSFICYGSALAQARAAGKDLVPLYKPDVLHTHPYLIPEISNWIIGNNIEIESMINNYEHDRILSDYLSIKFKNLEDKIYFILRFEG